MKKYFSNRGVFVLGTILSIILSPYTVGPIVRFFVPISTGLAAIPLTGIFAPPLLIMIIPLLPIILTKIFIGNKKYIIWLTIYILFFTMANFYDLSKEDKLFKIPFLRANIAPITWFELAQKEKGIGVKLYAPSKQIQDFKPLYYIASVGSCGQLTFGYQDTHLIPLDIHQLPKSCEDRTSYLNFQSPNDYQEIYNKDGIVVKFDARSPSLEATYFTAYHKIYIGETLIVINPNAFNRFSREELIDIAKSLK